MRQRHTIHITPAGLVNAGGQATIPEDSFWEARNSTIGEDGRMSKRPGLRQHGQTLKAPISGGFSWQELFGDLSDFASGDIGAAGFATIEIKNGAAVCTTTSVTADRGRYIRRNAQPSDGAVGAGDAAKADLRMLFKANGALPAQSGTTEPNGFHVVMRSDHANLAVFLFLDLGIYYWNGTAWTLVTGTDVDDGSWHTIEFRLTSNVTAQIYVDESLKGSITFTSYTASISLTNERCALAAETNTNGKYEVEVDMLQYRSGNGNIIGVPVTSLYEWKSPNPLSRHLLAVAGSVVYDDLDHAGVFRAMTSTAASEVTTFTPFGSQLLVVNPRLPVRLWAGTRESIATEAPEVPSRTYVACQHQGRLAVVTEADPLLVLVGAANTLDDWTTPTFESPTGESFTVPLPDAIGERVTALIGDFYGQLVIFTQNSIYALVGSSVDTYYLRTISSGIGCVGPRAVARAGGDLIFLSNHGMHSLKAVQEYGDLSTAYETQGLRRLWQHDNQFDSPKVIGNYRSSVVYAPHLGRTFLALQTQEDPIPRKLYELNHDVGKWSGPWTLDCEAAAFVMLGSPAVPVPMFGDTSGRVSAALDDRKMDFGTAAYTTRLRSSRLDGRSLDPVLSHTTKNWRAMRLYVLPRGNWDLSLTWTSDGHTREGSDTPNQNRYNEAVLDTTFVLGTSKIVDSEKVGVIDIPLDHRGKWIEFTVEQSGLDEDMVLLRAEVDFTVANQDKEN